ncbi:MAG: thioredoxin family protein [Polyangiaceae bacterium]
MSTIAVDSPKLSQLLNQKGTVVLDFWASWCGPCRMFAPVFEAASTRHPGVVFGKVDTEAQPELASAFEVQAIPTLAVLRDGVLLFKQPGMVPARALDELITKIQGLDMEELRRKVEALEAKKASAAQG